jgi:TPR repeat protein
MKKHPLLFLVLLGFAAHAQQPLTTAPGQDLFLKGLHYLNGNSAPYDPEKAAALFHQSALAGNPQALNAVGNLYLNGTGPFNADSAVYYYKAAAAKGYASAYYNLGRLYQKGDIVPQNFTVAAQYYQEGAAKGDNSCKNELAYFYYKGFGVQQSYSKAFALYSQLAYTGDRNAQYFIGICYRNGYGTEVNKDLSTAWLVTAARSGEGQADHEFNSEPLPENAYVYNPGLEDRVKQLQGYTERFTASGSNDISGAYKGYAVYYDFSRQFAVAVVPLSLDIVKRGGRYEGTWAEGDSLSSTVKASFDNNNLVFDSSCRYTRHNHYSDRNAEDYVFNKAALSIKYANDSMYLAGDMQFYSITRKEPGQPVYIALSKPYDNAEGELNMQGLTLSPNPANTFIRAAFELKNAASIQIQITDMQGNILQKTTPEKLPAGNYSYDLPIQSLANGSYVLKLSTGTKAASKIFIKL